MSIRLIHQIPTIALIVLVGICGCDKPANSKTPPVVVVTSRPVTGPVGNVKGVALFKGTLPPPLLIMGNSCHAGARNKTILPVMVGPNRELLEAVVFLKGAGGDAPDAPSGPIVVLDQINCQYSPSAVALHTGQTLRVTSQDPTLHNVHFLTIDNPATNVGMNGAGQKLDVSFKLPELFEVKCDVHPWMSASVNVFDHPYFAVTDLSGKFEIKNVPIGKQTIIFRHPYLHETVGDVEVEVTVEEGKTANVTGTFEKAEK